MVRNFILDGAEEDVKESIARFSEFTTYFVNFHQNRRNMYSPEAQATAISNRCVNENLPRFLDNARNYAVISGKLEKELEMLNADMSGFSDFTVSDRFSLDYFAYVLPQSGIDDYNRILGGYSTEDGTKIKGLNEYINLYNQTAERNDRIPLLKVLYKQILSDRDTVSFIPESFGSDQELLDALYAYLKDKDSAKTADIAVAIGLGITRTKELIYDMPDVEALGGNRNRTYRLKQ
ncbi:MAG: hypothetical protein IJL78_11070 [Lachnospiraceae bacterium]|nr:hypothetical protein [Lachnospiraceae bacterium]